MKIPLRLLTLVAFVLLLTASASAQKIKASQTRGGPGAPPTTVAGVCEIVPGFTDTITDTLTGDIYQCTSLDGLPTSNGFWRKVAQAAAADIPTGIDAAKLANGNVSNTEFQYLDGVTSAIQTQLNAKQAANLRTSFQVTPDDTHYPSEKLTKDSLDAKVTANVGITGATKTKITYDAKGLVTSGADANTADVADSTDKRYVTDAQRTVIGNTSGANTGDETQATIISKLGYTPPLPTLSGLTNAIGGGVLTAGSCASGDVTVTNSTTSMTVTVSPNTYPGDGAVWRGYVSTNGTVTVKVCAIVGLTPTASTYNVRVIQ